MERFDCSPCSEFVFLRRGYLFILVLLKNSVLLKPLNNNLIQLLLLKCPEAVIY